MNGKRAKAIQRKIRQHKGAVVAESIGATLKEPWPVRVRTGVYIASGGRMWVARLFTWALLAATAWNAWEIIR